MKTFILKAFIFILIPVSLFASILFLPATPRAKTTLLFSKKQKTQLLETTQSPRIILIGGSNVSFGIDSKLIKENLGINPINTGIHANLGLVYMMDSTIRHIRQGDIVVVIPEYNQFFGKLGYGGVGPELLRLVFDASREDIFNLRILQWKYALPYIPNYFFSKIKYSEYRGFTPSTVYHSKAFNEFGDVDVHWLMKKTNFKPYGPIRGIYNPTTVEAIVEFEQEVIKKGAVLYVTYPGLHESTFNNQRKGINQIHQALTETELTLLGTPERYIMPDSAMFNSPYHLSKVGMELRSDLLIEDLRIQKSQ